MYDYLIVGCGLSGAVLAYLIATKLNKKILMIDKRNHIGGNIYDYYDENKILIHKYGPHVFHTNDEEVWEFINNFVEWVRFDIKTKAFVDNQLVPIPVNINTVNLLCKKNISTESEMLEYLKSIQIKYDKIENSEEMAMSRVGLELYNKLFKGYTTKQWNRAPSDLDSSVTARIPIRSNFDDRYFSDKYQALPRNGYTNFVEKVITHPNITIKLNTDYFKEKNNLEYKILIFTGPIDQYYTNLGLNYDALEYRSLEFVIERYENMNYYQTAPVINYSEINVPYTRIVEYKHFLNQKSENTTIVKEYPKETGEPYYPIPNKRNQELYEKYAKLASQDKNIHFVGRLANYKYFNMDQAIKNALEYFNNNFINNKE